MKKIPQRQFKLDKYFRTKHTKLYAIFLAAVELCKDEWVNELLCPMDTVKKIGKVLYHRTPADCQRVHIREYMRQKKRQLLTDIEDGVHIFDITEQLEYVYGKKLACLRELQKYYYTKDGRCSPPRWSDADRGSPVTITLSNGIIEPGHVIYTNDSNSQSPQPTYENMVITPLWNGGRISQTYGSSNTSQRPRILSRSVPRTRSSPQTNRTQVTEEVDVIIIDEEEEKSSSSSSPLMICESGNSSQNDLRINEITNGEDVMTDQIPINSEKCYVSKTYKKLDQDSQKHLELNSSHSNENDKNHAEKDRIIKKSVLTSEFICPSCGTHFISEGTLEAHRMFYCTFRIRNNEDYDNEIEETLLDTANPSRRKPYACSLCLFSSDVKSRLNKHLLMHKVT